MDIKSFSKLKLINTFVTFVKHNILAVASLIFVEPNVSRNGVLAVKYFLVKEDADVDVIYHLIRQILCNTGFLFTKVLLVY